MNFDPSIENQLEIHARVCSLLSREQFGSHNKNKITHDCWIIMNKIKVLIFQYFDQRNQNDINNVNMQLMFQHINDNFYHLEQFYTVLKPKILAGMPNFFEVVLMPITEFYIKQWNTMNTSFILQNIAYQKNQSFSECICQLQSTPNIIQHCITNNKFCYRCGQTFHNNCFNIKESEFYQCPFCFLRYCLPDREVVHVLFKGYLPPAQQNKSTMSIIQVQWPMTQYCSQKVSIQFRCTPIGLYELAWPQSCDIYLDDSISVSFKPLLASSSLKSRHDNPIIIPIRDLASSQKIKINEHFINAGVYHLLGIFVVIEKNQRQIFDSIIQNPFFSIEQTESKSYLQKLFWKTNFLQMDQLRISNKCQFYGQNIVYPCRSRHCTNHYQPFDLYNFVCSGVKAKNSIKRWKCPICGVRAYDIVRDLYLESLLNHQKNAKQIGFVQEMQGSQIVINPKIRN